jgi:hypothetical protein
MAQFFEYKCELQAANLGVTASAWSAGDQPVLAVAADNGTIAFYAEEVPCRAQSHWQRAAIYIIRFLEFGRVLPCWNESAECLTCRSSVCVCLDSCWALPTHHQGERLEEISIIRNAKCISLAWHPKLMILASGWDDGMSPRSLAHIRIFRPCLDAFCVAHPLAESISVVFSSR